MGRISPARHPSRPSPHFIGAICLRTLEDVIPAFFSRPAVALPMPAPRLPHLTLPSQMMCAALLPPAVLPTFRVRGCSLPAQPTADRMHVWEPVGEDQPRFRSDRSLGSSCSLTVSLLVFRQHGGKSNRTLKPSDAQRQPNPKVPNGRYVYSASFVLDYPSQKCLLLHGHSVRGRPVYDEP